MNITQEILDASTWGTGWGSTRHLIDHASARLRVPDHRSYHDRIRAQCSEYTGLRYLEADPERGATVMKKRACKHCAKRVSA